MMSLMLAITSIYKSHYNNPQNINYELHYDRGAPIVFILHSDILFFCMGSGEYDEMSCKLMRGE